MPASDSAVSDSAVYVSAVSVSNLPLPDSAGPNPPVASALSAGDRTAAGRFEGMFATAVASPFFLGGMAMTVALGIVGVLVAGR